MRLTRVLEYVAALRYAIFPSDGINEDRWCRVCSKGFRTWLGLALHLEGHTEEEMAAVDSFFVSGSTDSTND